MGIEVGVFGVYGGLYVSEVGRWAWLAQEAAASWSSSGGGVKSEVAAAEGTQRRDAWSFVRSNTQNKSYSKNRHFKSHCSRVRIIADSHGRRWLVIALRTSHLLLSSCIPSSGSGVCLLSLEVPSPGRRIPIAILEVLGRLIAAAAAAATASIAWRGSFTIRGRGSFPVWVRMLLSLPGTWVRAGVEVTGLQLGLACSRLRTYRSRSRPRSPRR